MTASIIRIVGPSYCGSTALGCALNTGTGFFFGSEMYRYLESWRIENTDGRFISCDFCGPECNYWTPSLKSRLKAQRANRLELVHDELLRNHPEIDYLVDGSKSIPDQAERQPDVVIVPTKHPVRLLASHVYNRRTRLGIDQEELEGVGAALEQQIEVHTPALARGLKRFINQYLATFDNCQDALRFRTDDAHLKDFAEFRRLESNLGLSTGFFDPANFTLHPSHTLGGNRAPIWLAKSRSGRETPQNARTDYYNASSGAGDWKLDDKYRVVFTPLVLDVVQSLPEYRLLCELLAYDPLPPIGLDE